MSAKEQLDRLKAQVGADAAKKKKESAWSWYGRASKEVTIVQKFVTQVGRVLVWMWWNLGNPFLNIFTIPVFRWIVTRYMSIWNRFAVVKDENGVPRLSYKRGAAVILSTLFVFWFGLNSLIFVKDATLFFTPWTSYHGERVYLFGNHDNSFDGEEFSVTGCDYDATATEFECSSDETIYYRAEASWFNNVWSMIHNGNALALFLPENAVAPIAPGWNDCRVDAYGLRVKFLIRHLQWYVELLYSDCRPVLQNDLKPAA